MIYSVFKYNALPLNQKAAILGEDGAFIMNISEHGTIYSLYAHFGFYMEVTLEEHTGRLIDIVAFEDKTRLDKYLDKIALIL